MTKKYCRKAVNKAFYKKRSKIKCRRPVSLFMNEGSTVAMETGILFLKIVSPFYFVISVKLMADGVLRGAGAMAAFMTATFTDLVLRVVLAFLFSAFLGAAGIWLSWPVGWITAAVLSVIFYQKGVWRNRAVTEEEGHEL